MASKRSLGSLLVQVGADTKQLNSALGDAEAKVKGFGSRVKREATGTRASFSGMGNSASAALSRMGALGGGLSMLGGLGTAAGVAGLGAGVVAAVKGTASRAHSFSARSVQDRAKLSAEGVDLDKRFGENFGDLFSFFNNFGARFENATTRMMLEKFGNEDELKRQMMLPIPGGAPGMDAAFDAGRYLGELLNELVGLRQDVARTGNEIPPAPNQSAPMVEAPASGPPMNALGNNRGGY